MTTSAFRITALGVVGAIYVVALMSLHPSVFWSPDEGAKFIQMHSQLLDPTVPHRIAYGAVHSDPLFSFYPTAFIYPQPLWPHGVHHHWSALFPLVSLPFFQLFGIRGIYVLPLVCGLLSTVLVSFLAKRVEPEAAPPALLLAGLGTPLLFQSMLFLEHTLACALGLGALLCGWMAVSTLTRPRRRYAVMAIFCLAGLFALRDEALIFVAAMACAGLRLLTRDRISSRLRAGALLILLLLVLVMVKTSGDAAGGSSRTADLAFSITASLQHISDPALWRELPPHILHVLINDPGQSGVPLPLEWALTGLAGVGLCGLSLIVLPGFRFPFWLLGACLVGATSAAGLCLETRYRAVHGLLLSMPCLVLAWLPAPGPRTAPPGRSEVFLASFFPIYLVIFVLATWLLRRPTGGPEWGLRYALFAFLLAAVLGAVSVTRFAKSSRGWQRLAGVGLAILLFILSCGFGIRGIFEAQVTKRDLHAFEQEMRAAPEPIVTDQWWLAAALAPTFVSREFYTLTPQSDATRFLDHIGRQRTSLLYVSYATPPDSVMTPQGVTAHLTRRRVIQEMTFSWYAIQGSP